MLFLLAAYDPACENPLGDYWDWKHPALPKAVLDSFYYDIACNNRPDNPNLLEPTDCVGGWAGVDETWACWYRFLNGGRDLRGRPGRFVIVSAFYRRCDYASENGFEFLNSPLIQNLARIAPRSCPLPRPDLLEVDVNLSTVEALPANGRNNTLEFNGSDAPSLAVEACGGLPLEYGFRCSYVRHCDICRVGVSIIPPKVEPLPPQSPKETPLPTVPVQGEPVPQTVPGKNKGSDIVEPVRPADAVAPLSRRRRIWYMTATVLLIVIALGWWWLRHAEGDSVLPQPGDHSGQVQPLKPDEPRPPTNHEANKPDRQKSPVSPR